jgi:uncharacterized protein (DUF433 family)
LRWLPVSEGGCHLFARVTRAGASPARTLNGSARSFVAGYGLGTPPLAPALVNARLMQKLDAHPVSDYLLQQSSLYGMLLLEKVYMSHKKLIKKGVEYPMQLEEYFDFLSEDDIRLKGTRVGIETVLYDYIHRQRSPEVIAQTYPSLTLEQVYATILYYLRNKEVVSKYLTDWLEWGREMRKQQSMNPSPESQRLRKIKEERQSYKETA